MQVLDVLINARARYAESPSHAPAGRIPERGTYCVLTALSVSSREVGFRDYFGIVMEMAKEVHTENYNASNSTENVLRLFNQARGSQAVLLCYNASNSTENVLRLFDRVIDRLSNLYISPNQRATMPVIPERASMGGG